MIQPLIKFHQKSQQDGINEHLLSSLKSKIINFNGNRWFLHNMKHISSLIFQWNIETMLLYNNNEKQMIEQLQTIQFPSLKLLNLRVCHIQSIEKLHRLNMPVLSILLLDYNHIATISSLKKAIFRNMESLQLTFNKFTEENSLNKMRTPKMKVISIQVNTQTEMQFIDIRNLLKLQTEIIEELFITNFSKGNQKEGRKKLKQKYKNLTLGVD